MKKYSLIIVLSLLVIFVGVFAYVSNKAEAATTEIPCSQRPGCIGPRFVTAWSSVSGALSYDVYIYLKGNTAGEPVLKKNVTVTSVDLTNELNQDSEYVFKVRAVNKIGTSAFSSLSSVTKTDISVAAGNSPVVLADTYSGYNFTNIDLQLSKFEKAYAIYKTIGPLKLKAKANDTAYKTAYATAVKANKALEAKNTTTNLTTVNTKLLDLQKKSDTAQKSLTNLTNAINALNAIIPLSDELLVNKGSVTIDPSKSSITVDPNNTDSYVYYCPSGYYRCPGAPGHINCCKNPSVVGDSVYLPYGVSQCHSAIENHQITTGAMARHCIMVISAYLNSL
ncbi:MAG: fibronectin type III domain-containing protein [Minisyncoccia bacterium]